MKKTWVSSSVIIWQLGVVTDRVNALMNWLSLVYQNEKKFFFEKTKEYAEITSFQQILTIFTQGILEWPANSSLCQLTMNEARRFFFLFRIVIFRCTSVICSFMAPKKCGTRTIMLMTSYLDVSIAKCFNLLIVQI